MTHHHVEFQLSSRSLSGNFGCQWGSHDDIELQNQYGLKSKSPYCLESIELWRFRANRLIMSLIHCFSSPSIHGSTGTINLLLPTPPVRSPADPAITRRQVHPILF